MDIRTYIRTYRELHVYVRYVSVCHITIKIDNQDIIIRMMVTICFLMTTAFIVTFSIVL